MESCEKFRKLLLLSIFFTFAYPIKTRTRLFSFAQPIKHFRFRLLFLFCLCVNILRSYENRLLLSLDNFFSKGLAYIVGPQTLVKVTAVLQS